MAAIWLRNEFMKDTAGLKNSIDEEKHLLSAPRAKMGDHLPAVMKHNFDVETPNQEESNE